MFRLIHYAGPYSDETSSYSVALDKEYTVGEFIDAVLLNKSEWGYIGIYDSKTIFGDPYCEYRCGELLTKLPSEYLKLKIKSATASGGWSRMDYLFVIEVADGDFFNVTEHYGIRPEDIYGAKMFSVYHKDNVDREHCIAAFKNQMAAVNECKYQERMFALKEKENEK